MAAGNAATPKKKAATPKRYGFHDRFRGLSSRSRTLAVETEIVGGGFRRDEERI